MYDINNMYIQDKPSNKTWMKPFARVKGKFAKLFLPNQNRSPTRGDTFELPVNNREFQPNWEAKTFKPIDFSYLKNASTSQVSAAVEWVNQKVGWFHSIDLKNGIVTPGSKGWKSRANLFSIPDIVEGKTVLDIGAMEGGDSFCAEEAGARVIAYDVDNYFGYDLGRNTAWEYVVGQYNKAKAEGPESERIFLHSKKLGFELCKQIRNSNVTRISGSVYDLDPIKHGTFDIVYCFGLLYHLRHPLLALDKIYSVTKEMTFINNQIFSGYSTEPNTILFFNDTWRGSYTNWFVPTPKTFIEMVSNTGYRKIKVIDVSNASISLICYK